MGLDTTTAVRIFSTKVARTRSIPFRLSAEPKFTLEQEARIRDAWEESLGDPVTNNSVFYQITRHNVLLIRSTDELNKSIVSLKGDLGNANPKYRCCVDFDPRLYSGTSKNPLTDERLRNVLPGQNESENQDDIAKVGHHHPYDKIFLAVHAAYNIRGERGMFLAVGRGDRPGLGSAFDLDRGAASTFETVFSRFSGGGAIAVYTCFGGQVPSNAGGLKLTTSGSRNDTNPIIEFEHRALKPWVDSECKPNAKPK